MGKVGWFFQVANRLSHIEIIDLLASTYSDMDYILEQDWDTGLRLLDKIKEKQSETKSWQLYCSIYPNFNKDNFIPFDKFYKKPSLKINNKPISQIIAEGEKIKKLFEKKG